MRSDVREPDQPATAGADRARWARLGDVIDTLVSADFTARGISHELYAAARERVGYSLTMTAALRLAEQVHPGDNVLICTGWPSRSWLMHGLTETDGPVGAAHLARALEECLGAVPIIVTEKSLQRVAEVALRSAGLIVSDVDTALRSKSGPYRASVGAVLEFPTDWAEAGQQATLVLKRLDPAAVISIEMPGANANGEFHNVTSRLVPTELVAKTDAIMREAGERGILTLGIGDGGNELGMGFIADAVRRHLPDGNMIAPVTDVDILIVGSISNWAAVGLSAAVSAVTGRPEFLAGVDLMRITDRVSDAGAIDGLTAYVDPKSDGMARASNEALVSLLLAAVRMHSSGWTKG